MPNGKRVEKFRENAKFTEQDVSKHLKTVTDVKVLQADGLIPAFICPLRRKELLLLLKDTSSSIVLVTEKLSQMTVPNGPSI